MLRLIVVGKPSREYRALIQEYEKRIKIEVLEYKENTSEDLLLEKVRGKLILLDIERKLVSSEEIAEMIKEDATFVIGGPEGLSNDFKKMANVRISFGRITLPHQLARLVLTEQIYRGKTIIEGKKYHK